MKYTLDELNNYKNKLIEAFVEETLYPQRTSIIKDKIDKCKLYESGKKRELEFQQKKLERNKLEAEKNINIIKAKAYDLMRQKSETAPAKDIWEETLVRIIREYVEKTYLNNDMPSEEDDKLLNEKLDSIGFGFDYYWKEKNS